MDNQDIKQDKDKWNPSLGFPTLMIVSSKIKEWGNTKYPNDSWKEVEPRRYFNAALRHLMYMVKHGTASLDNESGMPHLYHAIWNLGAMTELMYGEDLLPKKPYGERNITQEVIDFIEKYDTKEINKDIDNNKK